MLTNVLCNFCFIYSRLYDSLFHVINNVALSVTNVAKDLGVQVKSQLIVSQKYGNVVAKADQRASLI